MNIENNKLIAEFMGAIKGQSTEAYPNIYTGVPVNGMKTITVSLERMKFHNSWDWLMPVVEKIESLKGNFSIVTDGENTELYEKTKRLFYHFGPNRLESMYLTVVEFIKWHNSHSKTI